MRWQRLNLFRDLRGLGATRIELARLFSFTIFYALFEGVGIGILFPVLEYVETAHSGSAPTLWPQVSRLLEFLGITRGRYEVLFLLAVAFVALFVRSLLHYHRDIDAAKLRFKVGSAIRQRAVEGFVHADFTFLSAHDSGKLFSALTLEADRAAEALASRVIFMTAVALLAVYLLLLFSLSAILTLFTLPVFVVVGLTLKRQSAVTRELSRKVSIQNASFGSQVNDRLHGISRIKMRGEEHATINQMGRTIQGIAANLFGIERLRILVDIGMFPVLVLASFSMLYIAVEGLNMSLASLGAFMFIVVRLAPQVTLMNSMWTHMHGCMASFQQLEALIQAATVQRERSFGCRPFRRLETGISFCQVDFRYPGCEAADFALTDVSMTIPRGSLTALVGRSGAGKSTIVKLLTGFYMPEKGEIRLDGHPLTEFHQRELRRKMAVVPQEPYFFNDTVRANLLYGVTPPPRQARLEELLIQGNCAEFVSRLERGLETMVGEGGARLSHGQRQRLAIAHALAVEPEILILDEPTSALDSESEQAIQETLSRWRGRLTIVVIAHRLSTIRHADQILVIDYGRLVASGDHETLLDTSPLFKTLFEFQMIA